jgi:hypothetical protein
MKSVLVSILCLSIAIAPAVTAAPLSPPPSPRPQVSSAPFSGDTRFEQTGSKTGVETLRGDAALRHFANWRSQYPKAYAAAAAEFVHRGWRPTQNLVVMRSLRLTSAGWVPANQLPFRQVQDFSAPEGEVMFWSADDGNPATWEGTIYGNNYQTGEVFVLSDQVDISTDDPDVMSEDTIYDYFNKGGEELPVSLRGAGPAHSPYHRVIDNRNRGYLKCVIVGMGVAALRCAFAGPEWPLCFLAGAALAIIVCLINR